MSPSTCLSTFFCITPSSSKEKRLRYRTTPPSTQLFFSFFPFSPMNKLDSNTQKHVVREGEHNRVVQSMIFFFTYTKTRRARGRRIIKRHFVPFFFLTFFHSFSPLDPSFCLSFLFTFSHSDNLTHSLTLSLSLIYYSPTLSLTYSLTPSSFALLSHHPSFPLSRKKLIPSHSHPFHPYSLLSFLSFLPVLNVILLIIQSLHSTHIVPITYFDFFPFFLSYSPATSRHSLCHSYCTR